MPQPAAVPVLQTTLQPSRPPQTKKQTNELNKIAKKLRRLVGQAIQDYSMIRDQDRVMVCLSGGKDSYTLLDVLVSLQRNAPVSFSIVAVNLNQKQPDFPTEVLPRYLAKLGIEYEIVEEDTYSITTAVTPEGKTFCPICSRLRRGILYKTAARLKATKIALGHHLDDVVETLFLNMFFGGTLKAMPPNLVSDDRSQQVIRPLYYVREKLIQRYSNIVDHPIIPCNLCGSQENSQRLVIKELLADWDRRFPNRVESVARSIRNIRPSRLGDPNLFAFQDLCTQSRLHNVREEYRHSP
ncbi:MAG: tRNA 2-thiocytidine(32) synthetase TtcA [Gammaproteobacteria bacterium]|nr:tRNA 2-thiocytidine(32) synthetase TtcA [Gammaproteobacteria bacterium]MDE0251681.1 tRNA 2-thiocytidine(32) synthetase TtcA [Gammaproteobacteria bacterium]MDE0403310.1 tRNA 2-thiocytidine(32) synthetase TtcA [Gammaproteobacteria bacterium]